jgi:hypothetical protein
LPPFPGRSQVHWRLQSGLKCAGAQDLCLGSAIRTLTRGPGEARTSKRFYLCLIASKRGCPCSVSKHSKIPPYLSRPVRARRAGVQDRGLCRPRLRQDARLAPGLGPTASGVAVGGSMARQWPQGWPSAALPGRCPAKGPAEVVPSVVPSGQSKRYQPGRRCKFRVVGVSREYRAGRAGQKRLGPV